MSAAPTIKKTRDFVDEALPLWQQLTRSEDTRALVARSIVDALLDMKTFVQEYEELDLAQVEAA